MEKIIRVEREGAKKLSINWDLGLRCNIACSYCFILGQENKKFEDIANLKTVADNIENLGIRGISLTLTGGEPTFNPNFIELIKYLRDKGDLFRLISVQTNMCMPVKTFEKISSELKGMKYLRFSLSFHTEFADVEDVIVKLKLLKNAGLQISSLVVAHPEHVDKAKHAFNRLSEEGIRTYIKVVRQGSGIDKRYSEEDYAWVKQHLEKDSGATVMVHWENAEGSVRKEKRRAQELAFNNLHKFEGFVCHVPLENISIRQGGLYLGVCQRWSEPVADFYKPGVKADFLKPIICKKEYCNCLADVVVTKYRKGN